MTKSLIKSRLHADERKTEIKLEKKVINQIYPQIYKYLNNLLSGSGFIHYNWA